MISTLEHWFCLKTHDAKHMTILVPIVTPQAWLDLINSKHPIYIKLYFKIIFFSINGTLFYFFTLFEKYMEAISLSLKDHFWNFLGIPCVHLKVLFCYLDTNGIKVTIYDSCLFINMVVWQLINIYTYL